MAEYIEKAQANGALIENTALEGYDLEEAVNAICAIPAADVREVKHGKWIENKKKQTKVGDFVRRYWNCSECGIEICNTLPQFDLSAWHYCPNCGASMDGGVE